MKTDTWWEWREKEDHTPEAFPASMAWVLENPLSRFLASWQIRKLDVRPGMRVLDVGSGPGRFTIPVAKRVGSDGEVVAFDLQVGMLARLRARAAAEGLTNVRTVAGPAGHGVLRDAGVFDRALLVSVLGEIPEEARADALREILGALRPGGVLSVVEHFSDPDYLSPTTVRELGTGAGFEIAGEHRSLLGYTLRLARPS